MTRCGMPAGLGSMRSTAWDMVNSQHSSRTQKDALYRQLVLAAALPNWIRASSKCREGRAAQQPSPRWRALSQRALEHVNQECSGAGTLAVTHGGLTLIAHRKAM